MRNIEKFYPLGEDKKAGKYIGQQDVHCYRPPLGYWPPSGYSGIAELMQEQFASSEWWIFLSPEDYEHI